MAKNGYSRKGFFGETIHYDANGKKVGESVKTSGADMIILTQAERKLAPAAKPFSVA